MHGYQHKRMGVAAGVGVLAFTLMANAPPELAIVTVTAPMGAMLPDIDHDRSKLGQTRKKVTSLMKFAIFAGIVTYVALSYFSGGVWTAVVNCLYVGGAALILNIIERNKHIRSQMGFITKHRGIMHTLIPPAFIMGTTMWTSNKYYFYSMLGIVIGYVVHLIGDMGTEEGAPILWPFTRSNIRYLRFNTAKNKNGIELLCNIWCVILIALGVYIGLKRGA